MHIDKNSAYDLHLLYNGGIITRDEARQELGLDCEPEPRDGDDDVECKKEQAALVNEGQIRNPALQSFIDAAVNVATAKITIDPSSPYVHAIILQELYRAFEALFGYNPANPCLISTRHKVDVKDCKDEQPESVKRTDRLSPALRFKHACTELSPEEFTEWLRTNLVEIVKRL